MPRIGARPKKTNMNLNRLTGFALKLAFKLNRALPVLSEKTHNLLHQLLKNLLQRLAMSGGIFQLRLGRKLRRRAMRNDRLGDQAKRLTQSSEQLPVESRGQGIARQCHKLRDSLDSQLRKEFDRFLRQTQRGDR